MVPSREVAQLLIDWSNGDRSALDELFPIVLGELRRRAHNALRHERPNNTLETTALVHETYLKLARYKRPPCRGEAHFYAIAAQAMRYVLVDHAKKAGSQKRDGIKVQLDLVPSSALQTTCSARTILSLDEALIALTEVSPIKAQVAEMKMFTGSSNQKIAEALGLSLNQVTRYWRFAKMYLGREIRRRQCDV